MIYMAIGFVFILMIVILYSQYKDKQLEDADRLLRGHMINELNLLLKEIAYLWRTEDRYWQNLLITRYALILLRILDFGFAIFWILNNEKENEK